MRYEIYKDDNSQWRWHLKAANNKIIADSGESYNNKQDLYHAIKLFIDATSKAEIVEKES